MTARAHAHASPLDFDGVGRTLELMDGEQARLAIGFADGSSRVLLGGSTGRIHVTTKGELEAQLAAMRPLGVKVASASCRAYMFEVGEVVIAVGDAEFTEASYKAGALQMQLGPVSLAITVEED
jgi:hypothetical protein